MQITNEMNIETARDAAGELQLPDSGSSKLTVRVTMRITEDHVFERVKAEGSNTK